VASDTGAGSQGEHGERPVGHQIHSTLTDMNTSRPQRLLVAGVLASLLFGTAACGASTESTASAAATSSVSASAADTTTSTTTDTTTESPTLESLVAEVAGQFQQFT
jgi:hypothetical protein